MTNCPHERRYAAIIEDYSPLGTVEIICCADCFEHVGDVYHTSSGKIVVGEGVSFVPGSNRVLIPSFELRG